MRILLVLLLSLLSSSLSAKNKVTDNWSDVEGKGLICETTGDVFLRNNQMVLFLDKKQKLQFYEIDVGDKNRNGVWELIQTLSPNQTYYLQWEDHIHFELTYPKDKFKTFYLDRYSLELKNYNHKVIMQCRSFEGRQHLLNYISSFKEFLIRRKNLLEKEEKQKRKF